MTPAPRRPPGKPPGQTTAAGTGATAGSGSEAGSSAASSAPQITSGQATGAPASGGVFTIALANDPGNLDPSMTALSVTRFVSHLAYDTLLSYKTDGTAVSGLAKSWKVSPDKVVFTMVPDVTCSDGSKFTPSDAADNLNYVSDPANKSPLTGVFIDPGTKAVGDDAKGTLTVTGPQPNAFLLNNLANVFMICKAGLADHSQAGQGNLGYRSVGAVRGGGRGPLQLHQAGRLHLGPGRPDGDRTRIAGLGQRPDHHQPDHGGEPAALRRGQHGHGDRR